MACLKLAVAALLALGGLCVSGASAVDLPLWPQPAQVTTGASTIQVVPSPGFLHVASGSESRFLESAFQRYRPLLFPHSTDAQPISNISQIVGLRIEVESIADDHPQVETDESYTLSIPAHSNGVAKVVAKTVYGALRGLESFSQLTKFDFDAGMYKIASAPIAIDDAPRFPHRGLMVDTGRHYLPLAVIRGIIDSLPYAKLNVLHWHMVDIQSFPFESTSSPKLWDGAFSPAERYTQADVAGIVEYARLHGVRVVVEFDMPGHASSWCKGYPEICPSTQCTQPLNVASNRTFDLINSLIQEVTGGRASKAGHPSGLFPDNFMHLGGDEVDTTCWSTTPAVADWLKEQRMTPDEGYAYFVKKVAEMVIEKGHLPVQWSEVFDHFGDKLPKQTVIHVWKGNTNVREVVKLGYNVLKNVGYFGESWYLDNLDVDWSHVYQNEPCQGIPEEDLCKLVLGGHGEMWGEKVDGSNLQQTVWPRLAAIAEKLWSPRAATDDPSAATARIHDFRCLLLERGVAAAPVDNKLAHEGPSGPASCYTQPGKSVLV